MKLADRIANSATMQMKEKAAQLAAKGIKVIDLAVGEPDFDTPEPIRKAAAEAMEKGFTHYTSAQGIAPLRKAIAAFWSNRRVKASADDIVVTPGAKQAIFYTLASILDEGDEVLLPEPAWLSYADITKVALGKPVPVPSTQEEGFVCSKESIKSRVTKKTKAIIINNPVNPTGALYEPEYVEWLSGFCAEKGIYLISDEIYCDIIYGGKRFASAAEFGGLHGHVIIINGVSKMAAMTGWRLGYLMAKPSIVADCVKMQQQTATCPSSISQYAAVAAFERYKDYMGGMQKEYTRRKEAICSGIGKIGKLGFFEPRGTFYLFVDIRKLGMSSDKAAEFMLEHAHVACVPGSAFGKSGEGYLRLSFASSMENLNEAVESIAKACG